MKSVGKHIGSSFLLLAMLVLFAHAIVPHHHHNQQVCTQTSDCLHHQPGTTYPEKNHHPHDGKNSCCVLNQLVVIPNNQWKQECSCTAASDKHFHELVPLISAYNPPNNHSFDIPHKLVPETTRYSLLLPASLHLRAPPVV